MEALMTREDALIELMRAHQRGIWRYLRFLGADVALADDLTQETFIAAFEKPFDERGHAATAAYLRLAARNLYLNVLRREKKQLPFDVEEAERAWLALTPSENSDERLELLQRCLDELPERGRRAIDLEYREGKGGREIASLMQTSEDAIKALLKRARGELRDCIEAKQRRSP